MVVGEAGQAGHRVYTLRKRDNFTGGFTSLRSNRSCR